MSRLVTDAGLAPLTVALASSSVLLFGAGALEVAGPVAVVRDKLGPVNLKHSDRVKVFAAYYRRAAIVFVGSAAVGAAASLFAAYKTNSGQVYRYALASAAGALSIVPYTLTILMPTNKALLALDEKAQKGDLTTEEDAQVMELIDKWSVLHPVRFVGYTVAWVSALGALTSALSRPALLR